MKKTLQRTLLSLIIFSFVFAQSAFAFVGEQKIDVDKELKNPIVIRNMKDLEKMNSDAVREYDEKLDSIPEELKNKFTSFNQKEEGFVNSIQSIDSITDEEVNMDIYVEQFIEQYPEYKNVDKDELKEDLKMLRANPVVSAVRYFFSSNGYDLALTLFNHSLTDNPAPANMTLIGNNSGIYSHIKGLLYNDGFIEMMNDFSQAGSNYYSPDPTTDYAFQNGDLYWAIHGFTWKKTRTMFNKAYFKIIDEYDFEKWRDIPGVVAGFAGTNDFSIEIYGLVQNGTCQ